MFDWLNNTKATNPALIESAAGTPGYGTSSASKPSPMQLSAILKAITPPSQRPSPSVAAAATRSNGAYMPGGGWVQPSNTR